MTLHFDANVDVIYANSLGHLFLNSSGMLTTRLGWYDWIKFKIFENSEKAKTAAAIIQTLKQMKAELNQKPPICFFFVSLGINVYPVTYKAFALKIQRDPMAQQNQKLRDAAEEVIFGFSHVDFDIQTKRKLLEREEDALRRFVIYRICNCSSDIETKNKLLIIRGQIDKINEEFAKKAIWDDVGERDRNPNWVLSGEATQAVNIS